MKEAIGNSMIFTLVITFVSIFIIFFAGFTNYTKAFKVKNRIISILEDRKYSEITSKGVIDEKVRDVDGTPISEIKDSLSSIGYRTEVKNTCDEDLKKRFETKTFNKLTPSNNSHRYCIASFKTSKGYYYAVITYMYFEIPLIGTTLEFPVYGETRIIGLLD